MTKACTCRALHSQQQSHSAGACGKQGRRRASSAAAVPIATAITSVSRGRSHSRCKALLVTRGGDRGGGGRKSWLGPVGSNDDTYDEFPEDFDYENSSYDPDHLSDDDVVGSWSELEDESGKDLENAATVKGHAATATAAAGTGEERGSAGAGSKRARRLPSGLGQLGGSRRLCGSPASALGANPTAPGLGSSPPPTAFPSTPPSSSVIRNAPSGLALDPDFSMAGPRTLLGAALGALAGLLGLKIWEAFVHRRGSRRDDGGWREGRGVRGTAAMSEEALKEQQTKIEALEDQLAYLEEDRRRAAAAAKEARANRRKDDRELGEYVRTLEVHLDQLSREKKEMEASIVESVRAETAKALKGAQEAAAAVAAEEVLRLKADLEATSVLLEKVLEEKETVLREKDTVLIEKEAALLEKEGAEREKEAADTLLRREQERGGKKYLWRRAFGLRGGTRGDNDDASHDGKPEGKPALEEEVERLRESSAALNRRFFEAVAKADGAEAARQEEAEKCRREMESALAEEKDRLRKQMEARVAAMRAGLKRRLQEARAERAGRSKDVDERDSRTD